MHGFGNLLGTLPIAKYWRKEMRQNDEIT